MGDTSTHLPCNASDPLWRPLPERTERALRILDLGAGNGWMSYRLALQGHLPIAVDLLTNDRDGLGAAFAL